jgi:hypothetical protein
MPQIYIPKTTENDRQYYRKLIFESFSDIVEQLETSNYSDETLKSLIKHHKRLIHSLNLKGKAKYKTLTLLEYHLRSPNKLNSLVSLMNYKNKRI